MKTAAQILILLAVTSAALIGCEPFKPKAIGNDDEIHVFADSADWTALEAHLREALERKVLTPQPEKIFTVRLHPIEEFEDYKVHKNLLIVAPLSSEGPTAQFLRGSLSPEVRALVESGEDAVINKYDLYRRRQIVMFLTAKNLNLLVEKIHATQDPLLYYFQKASLERELSVIYEDADHEKTDLKKRFLRDYEWTMFIQPDYWVAADSNEARFVWLRRAVPADMERWIFVHWINYADPALLNQPWVFDLRNELTKRFYRTIDDTVYVQIADDFKSIQGMSIRETNFLGRYGYEMRGLWRFSDLSGGGPFVNYTIYDDASRRIYMIDGSIYAPRYEKRKLILQIDALAHTFQTIHDLTEEQLDDLLGEDRKKEEISTESKTKRGRSDDD